MRVRNRIGLPIMYIGAGGWQAKRLQLAAPAICDARRPAVVSGPEEEKRSNSVGPCALLVNVTFIQRLMPFPLQKFRAWLPLSTFWGRGRARGKLANWKRHC